MKLPRHLNLQSLGLTLYLLLTGWLLRSVLLSGYSYQLDIDEYYHAQLVYLLANGQKAFTSFYASVYPPLFHWLFLPLFHSIGPVFPFLYASRVLMGGLLVIRLLGSAFIAQRLFGWAGAAICLALILLDPMSTFMGMQIRPDNLMVTLFIVGLAFIVEAMRKERQIYMLIAGVFLCASCLVLIKMLPAFIVLSALLFLYVLIKRKAQLFFAYSLGIFLTFAGFFLYFSMQGSWDELVRQVVWDSITTFSQFLYPVRFGYFLMPDNFYIFGFPGKPLTWVYMWLYMLAGFAGIYSALQVFMEKPRQWKSWMFLSLGAIYLVQFIFLFTFSSVFIQYYIVVFWFAGLVTTGAVTSLLTRLSSSRSRMVLLLLIIPYAVFARSAVMANTVRAGITSEETRKYYEIRWKQFPSDAYVFPGYLFRPQAFPLPYGIFFGNYPPEILARMPAFESVLEEKKVQYVLMNDWEIGFLKPETRSYLETQYEHAPGDKDLWLRKK